MVPVGSALSAIAQLLPHQQQKEGAVGIVVAARKCARLKAAPLLLQHVVSVASMVLVEHASMMDAPLTYNLDQNIAENMAVETRSRAPWQAASPPLLARVSVPNMAAV